MQRYGCDCFMFIAAICLRTLYALYEACIVAAIYFIVNKCLLEPGKQLPTF